ncbi:hypothetical protein [Fodinibius sediminis]|uniref:Uncharacterized protein n=1 Tax=Fodinibius sediminis TaxID=1214077 RepID=A0A521E617_9BACT|nr:hypothetical protein [Fodinibius sediminis]SMO79388.1 hypothetical protein SAMN06265218_113146 [Fodinibius sediminis]
MDTLKYLSCIPLISLLVWGCSPQNKDEYRVEITAYDYAFQAPAELPSGWITFILNNEQAHKIHELSFARISENITYREYLDEYVGAWEILLEEFQAGEVERSDISERVNELLPDWADGIKYVNARGLVSPGRSAEKTVYLEPGLYAVDCWVKTEDGVIHLVNGMTRPLTITDESTNSPEPSVENIITLKEKEIDVQWKAEAGSHSFAVLMEADSLGNPVHNNIHLIKTEGNTDLNEVNTWMDWYKVGGLRTPAPADFLGGVSTYDAIPGESATYFSLEIDEPGEYAWIVQVPEGEPLRHIFNIP